jgi:probable phosphoglycerate mutase
VTRILSSPLRRACETAAPLASKLAMEIEISEALNEMDFGEWTGQAIPKLARSSGFQRFNDHRSLARAPGGESMIEVQARVVAAMLRWRDEMPGGVAALFSHGEPIRAALLYFTGLPIDAWARHEVALASVATVEMNADEVRVSGVTQRREAAV